MEAFLINITTVASRYNTVAVLLNVVCAAVLQNDFGRCTQQITKEPGFSVDSTALVSVYISCILRISKRKEFSWLTLPYRLIRETTSCNNFSVLLRVILYFEFI